MAKKIWEYRKINVCMTVYPTTNVHKRKGVPNPLRWGGNAALINFVGMCTRKLVSNSSALGHFSIILPPNMCLSIRKTLPWKGQTNGVLI